MRKCYVAAMLISRFPSGAKQTGKVPFMKMDLAR